MYLHDTDYFIVSSIPKEKRPKNFMRLLLKENTTIFAYVILHQRELHLHENKRTLFISLNLHNT